MVFSWIVRHYLSTLSLLVIAIRAAPVDAGESPLLSIAGVDVDGGNRRTKLGGSGQLVLLLKAFGGSLSLRFTYYFGS